MYDKIIEEIQKEWDKLKDEKYREGAEVAVPTASSILGVRQPFVNEMAKKYASYGLTIIQPLWENPIYENKMLAVKIWVRICNKHPETCLKWIKENSKYINDWAICDTLGMGCSRKLMKKFTQDIWQISDEMIHSPIMWERRLALVLLEPFCKDKKLHIQIYNRVQLLKDDKEYYIKKAVKWIERDLMKNG